MTLFLPTWLFSWFEKDKISNQSTVNSQQSTVNSYGKQYPLGQQPIKLGVSIKTLYFIYRRRQYISLISNW